MPCSWPDTSGCTRCIGRPIRTKTRKTHGNRCTRCSHFGGGMRPAASSFSPLKQPLSEQGATENGSHDMIRH
jgi:hypothetical protein